MEGMLEVIDDQTTVIGEPQVTDGFGANGAPGPSANANNDPAPEVGAIVLGVFADFFRLALLGLGLFAGLDAGDFTFLLGLGLGGLGLVEGLVEEAAEIRIPVERAFVPADAPEHLKKLLRNNHASFFGPGGILEQEDSEVWIQQFKGSNIDFADDHPYFYGLGLGEETSHPDLPGLVSVTANEFYARHFFSRWRNDLKSVDNNGYFNEILNALYFTTAVEKFKPGCY